MKPCDANSQYEEQKLETTGYWHNDQGIEVSCGRVRITNGPCKLYLNKKFLKAAAEWYLKDQPEGRGQYLSFAELREIEDDE